MAMVRAFTSGIANGICREILALKHKTRALPGVENKFFTPHGIYFIGNLHHINKLWILKKPLLKPKRAHIHKMTPKPMVHNPWRYYLIKAHSSSSWHNISFSAYDPSS